SFTRGVPPPEEDEHVRGAPERRADHPHKGIAHCASRCLLEPDIWSHGHCPPELALQLGRPDWIRYPKELGAALCPRATYNFPPRHVRQKLQVVWSSDAGQLLSFTNLQMVFAEMQRLLRAVHVQLLCCSDHHLRNIGADVVPVLDCCFVASDVAMGGKLVSNCCAAHHLRHSLLGDHDGGPFRPAERRVLVSCSTTWAWRLQ
ncbi:MMK1, partial [Symbiodinium pilosum]